MINSSLIMNIANSGKENEDLKKRIVALEIIISNLQEEKEQMISAFNEIGRS